MSNVSTKPSRVVQEVMGAQADLQTALGFLRLFSHAQADGEAYVRDPDWHLVEERLAMALARMHALLDRLGQPMYDPARHPSVKPGPTAQLTDLRKTEELEEGDACEYRYPARAEWRRGKVLRNGGSHYWAVQDDEDGSVTSGLYIEHVRAPGTDPWS